MTAPDLPAVEAALRASWTRDTSDDPDGWSEDNRSLGQCAVSALVVRALYGGDIVIATVLDRAGERTPDGHAWNVLPDGRHVDFTFDQFRDGEGLGPEIVTEPVIDGDPRRAHVLAERVSRLLGLAIELPPVPGGVAAVEPEGHWH
ncbi:YunG family protein [Pseudonocardia sp. CA-107938]|uniref:YunG family protein n=1 Tax=Pseudonocardia sp. CA-107938 TaxID=3240021 RepID=UPI003D938DB4